MEVNIKVERKHKSVGECLNPIGFGLVHLHAFQVGNSGCLSGIRDLVDQHAVGGLGHDGHGLCDVHASSRIDSFVFEILEIDLSEAFRPEQNEIFIFVPGECFEIPEYRKFSFTLKNPSERQVEH